MSRTILYAKPSITQLEIDYVTDAVTQGWGAQCYEYIHRFQDAFAGYLGVRQAFATSSCTGALHMALTALEVGPGCEVIVPDLTWIASVSPITYVGARPVFVDVLESSWCIDPAALEAAVTPRTKAIIVVHLYGNAADMDAILAVAARHGLPVIEDAAEAIGSEWHGKRAGSMADFGAFSFHGTKTMTTGEGGALVTSRADLAEKVAVIDAHGRDPDVPKPFWCERVGLKYKMSNLQAALGCAQLERIGELVQKKREVFSWYRAAAAAIPDLAWNPEPEGTLSSYWMPTFVLGERWAQVDRDRLLEQLNAKGVAARPAFYPVSSFPPFDEAQTPVSWRLGLRGINVPNYFDMVPEDVDCVVQALSECLEDR